MFYLFSHFFVLQGVVPPGIPYIGVTLSDLTFMYDGNPDPKGDETKELINFNRWILVWLYFLISFFSFFFFRGTHFSSSSF